MTLKELKEEYRRQYEDKEINWNEAQGKLKARVDFKLLIQNNTEKFCLHDRCMKGYLSKESGLCNADFHKFKCPYQTIKVSSLMDLDWGLPNPANNGRPEAHP